MKAILGQAPSGQALIETVLALGLMVGILVALSQLFLLGMVRLLAFHAVGRSARALAIGIVHRPGANQRFSSSSLHGQVAVEQSYLHGRVWGVSLTSPHPLFRSRSYPGAPPDDFR
ncbi:MAG: hypothetical protein HYZ73_01180 [Elusimicrobia bacterium]|nr:hypothetical protein [Elusimicrobiota bacterium]